MWLLEVFPLTSIVSLHILHCLRTLHFSGGGWRELAGAEALEGQLKDIKVAGLRGIVRITDTVGQRPKLLLRSPTLFVSTPSQWGVGPFLLHVPKQNGRRLYWAKDGKLCYHFLKNIKSLYVEVKNKMSSVI